jgi:predicted MFS family arabinose efflux permease
VIPGPRALAWALAFGTAVIVTIEFSAVGLLPGLARDLGVSLEAAGRLVGGFALASCLLGPPLTVWAARRDARAMLVGCLAVFALGNLVAAAAPAYGVVMAVRLAEGAVLPVFVSLAIATLVRDAPHRPRARSLGLLNAAVVAGGLVALPATVVLAGELDWRVSFAALGLLALAGAAAAARLAPRSSEAPAREAAGLLRRPAVLAHLALSATTFAALFASYTYLAAYLEQVAGLDPLGIGAALAGFALAGLVGNAVAARLADRSPLGATILAVAAFCVVMASLAAAGDRLVGLIPVLAAWGAMHAALFVICQTRLLHAAPDAPAFASALNISACNLGIALGAVAGGWTVERLGLAVLGWSAAALGAAALLAAAAVPALSPQPVPRRPRSP